MAVDRNNMNIIVVYASAPRALRLLVLSLEPGATVADALERSGWCQADDPSTLQVGVWGRKAPLDQLLRDQDRVELYRSLRVDPKVARRQRFAEQGARAAGLFSRSRPGAKAGY